MAKIWELLDQANLLIRVRHFQEAQLILDEILRLEPQNMDAWDAYMRMCSTHGDFEGLKNHIRTIWATRVRDDDYLQAMQRFLLQRVDDRMQSV
jgi:predicted Zn-dependent protease